MKFKEQYFRDLIPFEDIDRFVSKWNFSDETCTLAAYLGLNEEEEDVWVSQSEDDLWDLLDEEKKAFKSCKKKILFTDLDGTLLNKDKEVTEKNFQAINKAVSAGHYIVLASGRALVHVIPIAEKLGMHKEGFYIVAFNGGIIYNCGTKKKIYNSLLDTGEIDDIFKDATEQNLHIQTYTDTYVLSNRDDHEIKEYCDHIKGKYMVAPTPSVFLDNAPNKLLLIDMENREPLLKFADFVQNKYPGKYDIFFSSLIYMEIVNKGVNKGAALHFLADYLNVPMENTIAAGDSENDIAMIREAAIGACMINGEDPVKELADYITENDNNHDGFAEIIEKFLL